MSNLPNTPEHDLFAGSPVIAEAEKALRAFEGERPLNREQAARLLMMWRHDSELTVRERQAVLARFPSPATVDGLEISEPVTVIEHAFTVDFDPDAQLFVWRCRCSWRHVQALDERDVRTALIMHLEGGQVYPPIADYRKRLDAWSKDQQIEADQRDREQR